LIAHFRGNVYVLGGFVFFALGTMGTCWVRAFLYKAKFGRVLYWVVINKIDTMTGEATRIGNFKSVEGGGVVKDIDRVIDRSKRRSGYRR